MTETPVDFWWDEPAETASPISVRHHVTAVLVNKNGQRWLTQTISAVRQQRRPADQYVAVDVASEDTSPATLAGHFDTLNLTDGGTFSEAVSLADGRADEQPELVEWLWLIHDDSAPEPQALEQLLAAADLYPHAAVLGPKLVDWRNPAHVLEVGVSLTGIGTRFTGLEHGERDQGQHDDPRFVLSVGSAGMLVRREVWRALGGFSPELPHFRADLEFCWRVWESGSEVVAVPAARVRHVSATARGIRPAARSNASAHYLDRRAGLEVLLSRTPSKWLWLRLIIIFLAGSLRSAGYVLVQDVTGARDEWRALIGTLLSRPQVLRLRTASGGGKPPLELRPTLREQISHTATETLGAVQATWVRVLDVLFPAHEHIDEVGYWQAFRAALRRPGVILAIGAIFFGFAFSLSILGSGQLISTAGVVPTDGAALWQEFLSGWHAVGMGSTLAAHPLQGFLALLSYLTGGNPAVLVKLLMVLGPWLAALSIHLALRPVLRHAATRVWLSALYGFSPAVIFSVAYGDIGSLLVAIAAPPMMALLSRTATSWRAAAGAGILASVLTAVWPAVWLMGAVALAWTMIRQRPPRVVWQRWLAILGWAIGILFPWSLDLLLDPTRWFRQFGAAEGVAPVWSALLGNGRLDSGFGWWWSLGLVLVAFWTLVDRRHSTRHEQVWTLAASLLVVGLVGQAIATWSGNPDFQPSVAALSILLTGLLVNSLAGSAGFLKVKLARADFGWRQLATGLALIAVTLAPIMGAWTAWSVPGNERLRVQEPVSSEMLRGYDRDLRLRTLLLSTSGEGSVRAEILDGRPVTFGDLEVVVDSDRAETAEKLVAWLTGAAAEEENPLRALGIGYIATAWGDPVSKQVASLGNLQRLLTARDNRLLNIWRVTEVPSRAYINAGIEKSELLQTLSAAPAAPSLTGVVLPATESVQVHLADRDASQWNAELAGRELTKTSSQLLTWVVPAGKSGELKVTFTDERRSAGLLVGGAALLLAGLVLAPRRRHAYRDEWLDE